MRVINLFTGYFLGLMVLEGIVVGTFDSKEFKDAGKKKLEKKAKIVGRAVILVGILLYIVRWMTK